MKIAKSRLGTAALNALVDGKHNDPFSVLGVHREKSTRIVRTFQPGAQSVHLLDSSGQVVTQLDCVHSGGVFEAAMPARLRVYRFQVQWTADFSQDIEDTYRFPATLGDMDLYLFGEGSHRDIYRKLGAHCITLKGVRGTSFSVWAPNASRVSVIGDFNVWDGRRNVMRLHPGNGIWEIFIPGVGAGSHYKFELLDAEGKLLPLKFDPVGQFHESPPGNASIVYQSRHRWRDEKWMANRSMQPRLNEAVSIYEVHLGSWRRNEQGGYLSYRELATQLTEYVVHMGFTHVELMPVSEHPFDGSWGYQPVGMFAATQRFGDPDDLRFLIDKLHQAGIAVIVDWVPAHFPRDEHGLVNFDGTCLYEYEDPRRGAHADWGTLIFNYGRREVVNYLIGSALYWIRQFHIDGLRVDAVASMLYLDYSREEGEWLPNEHGGNEHLEAVDFMHRLNEVVHLNGATTFAEESTSWPGVSRPVDAGGLGFTYKWNMGWMNDTLAYMSEDSIHRKHHHDKMTFGLVYAFNENFILPLSHDEVVHGKGSLITGMSGDEWQKFANLRAYFGFMFAHPGKKLLFMGGEFAQIKEWNHDQSLDWHLLDEPLHQGMHQMVRDLNYFYRSSPALYDCDFNAEGFEWLDLNDRDRSVYSWIRRSPQGEFLISVSNLTPVIREDYRIGVPQAGSYDVVFNTDREEYGGAGVVIGTSIASEKQAANDREQSISITLPPLSTIILGLKI